MSSFLTKLDPRTKIFSVIVLSIAVFLTTTFLSGAILTLFCLLLLVLSKASLKALGKTIKPFLFFYAFILLMSYNNIMGGFVVIWRFFLLIIIASLLTFTTSTSGLVHALEKLLYPLRLVRISPRNVSLMIAATIRFIPLMFAESKTLREAQKARLLKRMKLKHAGGFVHILFNKAIVRAAHAADAVDSRCYRDHSYTSFKTLHFKVMDGVALLFVLVIFFF